MQLDDDPLQFSDSKFLESVEIMIVEVTDGLKMDVETGEQWEEYSVKIVYGMMKVVFPHLEEKLIDFMNRCKLTNSRSMLCLRCNSMYDEKPNSYLTSVKSLIDSYLTNVKSLIGINNFKEKPNSLTRELLCLQ